VQAGVGWRVTARTREGVVLWVAEIPENLVVTAGLNLLLDRSFKTVPANVNWYCGLKGSGTPVAGDTMSSHASWSENTTYSNSTRPALTPGTIASGQFDNVSSPASFNINGTTTVYGVFLTTDNTKGGTSGTLYSAGDFASPQNLVNGNILSVEVTVRVTAA
jgi:hypothetical protein